MNNFSALVNIILLESRLASRQAFEMATPLLFFIMTVCLFPLCLGPDIKTLKIIAPGIIWVAALLAILLSLQQLFRADLETGALDLLINSTIPLPLLALAKAIIHWLMVVVPLLLVSPILAVMLNLSTQEIVSLLNSLLLGTPVLVLLGTLGAALTIGIQGRGLLIPILIMPFYIPVLIFGTSSLSAVHNSTSLPLNIVLLWAILFITLASTPWLTALALKNGVNQ